MAAIGAFVAAAPPCPPSALIVTKQIPAGTDTDAGVGVAVPDENSVVEAAPAGPENSAAATTANPAVAAAEPASRSLTRDLRANPKEGTANTIPGIPQRKRTEPDA